GHDEDRIENKVVAVLLEKKISRDDVGVSFERKRPVLQVREKRARDGVVEIEQLAFRVALGGEKNLIEMREFQQAPVNVDGGLINLSPEQYRAGFGFWFL